MRKAGAKHIYADTSSSDRYAGTRGFYQRMGFEEDARLPDFYAPGDGKVIYVKAARSRGLSSGSGPRSEPKAPQTGRFRGLRVRRLD